MRGRAKHVPQCKSRARNGKGQSTTTLMDEALGFYSDEGLSEGEIRWVHARACGDPNLVSAVEYLKSAPTKADPEPAEV